MLLTHRSRWIIVPNGSLQVLGVCFCGKFVAFSAKWPCSGKVSMYALNVLKIDLTESLQLNWKVVQCGLIFSWKVYGFLSLSAITVPWNFAKSWRIISVSLRSKPTVRLPFLNPETKEQNLFNSIFSRLGFMYRLLQSVIKLRYFSCYEETNERCDNFEPETRNNELFRNMW